MILRLGEIVFEKVCQFIRRYPLEQYGLHYIEVNLSVVQCSYEDLAQDYIRIMKKYEVSPNKINLEITESASTNAKKTLLGNMEELMEYGVKFSLDDFGTGYASLAVLKDIPTDIVKLDHTMIKSVVGTEKERKLIEFYHLLLQHVGIIVCAEGVENTTIMGDREQGGRRAAPGVLLRQAPARRGVL